MCLLDFRVEALGSRLDIESNIRTNLSLTLAGTLKDAFHMVEVQTILQFPDPPESSVNSGDLYKALSALHDRQPDYFSASARTGGQMPLGSITI